MIPTAAFGRTGHQSTRMLFGAAALGQVSQSDADWTLDVLLQHGINHIDTAANYGDSELRIGPWMPRHRDRFFLATKTQERTFQAAYDQIRRSLERLQVTYVDLLQLHYLVDPHEWEVAMGPGGALEAAIRAREEGLVRFIGVTGHDVSVAQMHMKSLARFAFDSVLLPCNYTMMQNPQYAADFTALMHICRERGIAVQAIKSLARGAWPQGAARANATWYEPLTEQADIDVAVGWVLGRPEGLFVNTSGDIHLLPKMLEAAERAAATPEKAPTDAAMKAVVDRLHMTPLFV